MIVTRSADVHLFEALERVPLWAGRTMIPIPLTGGLTNDNWLVTDDDSDERWVLKIPGPGTDTYIDRDVANRAAIAAAKIGITAAVLYYDQQTGIEVTEYLAGHRTSTTADLRDPAACVEVMGLYRAFHDVTLDAPIKTLVDMLAEHFTQLSAVGAEVPLMFRWLVEESRDLANRFRASGFDLVASHNDPMPGNFMRGSDRLRLIDFEFASLNDRSADLGLFLAEMFIDEPVETVLEYYFPSPTAQDIARVRASRVLADIKWGAWGLVNARVRQARFDYHKYGTWKFLRATTAIRSTNWDHVKAAI